MQLYQYSDLSGQFSLEYCHGLSMFGALSDESLEFLLTHGDIYKLAGNDRIYSLGDSSDMFFVILSGQARFYHPKTDSDDQIPLKAYLPGEQLGFVGMIGLQARHGNAVMQKEGFILEISSALFHELCDIYPEDFKIFMINVTREMSREIAQLDNMCGNMQST